MRRQRADLEVDSRQGGHSGQLCQVPGADVCSTSAVSGVPSRGQNHSH